MERFIHNQNLKNWRRQLTETTDSEKKSVLLALIADEEAREGEIEQRARGHDSDQVVPRVTPNLPRDG